MIYDDLNIHVQLVSASQAHRALFAQLRWRSTASQGVERQSHIAQGVGGLHVRGVPQEGKGEAQSRESRTHQGRFGGRWNAGWLDTID